MWWHWKATAALSPTSTSQRYEITILHHRETHSIVAYNVKLSLLTRQLKIASQLLFAPEILLLFFATPDVLHSAIVTARPCTSLGTDSLKYKAGNLIPRTLTWL